MSHSPKSLAYTPVKISRTNDAPVATARSMDARPSHNTFTPYGTEISGSSSPMMRAIVIAVIGSVLVR